VTLFRRIASQKYDAEEATVHESRAENPQGYRLVRQLFPAILGKQSKGMMEMLLLVLLAVAAAILLLPARNDGQNKDEFCALECVERQASHPYCDPTHTYCEQ
jgi:hypothetical protein